MTVEQLSPESQCVVRGVLAFVVTTPLLDGEFETRLGLERSDVAALLLRWPLIEARAVDLAACAVGNALNEVLRGLALSAADWQDVGAGRPAVEAADCEWATLCGPAASRR